VVLQSLYQLSEPVKVCISSVDQQLVDDQLVYVQLILVLQLAYILCIFKELLDICYITKYCANVVMGVYDSIYYIVQLAMKLML